MATHEEQFLACLKSITQRGYARIDSRDITSYGELISYFRESLPGTNYPAILRKYIAAYAAKEQAA